MVGDVVNDVTKDTEKSYKVGGSGSGSGGFSVISSSDSMIGDVVESGIFSVMGSSILNSISALILSFKFLTVL